MGKVRQLLGQIEALQNCLVQMWLDIQTWAVQTMTSVSNKSACHLSTFHNSGWRSPVYSRTRRSVSARIALDCCSTRGRVGTRKAWSLCRWPWALGWVAIHLIKRTATKVLPVPVSARMMMLRCLASSRSSDWYSRGQALVEMVPLGDVAPGESFDRLLISPRIGFRSEWSRWVRADTEFHKRGRYELLRWNQVASRV